MKKLTIVLLCSVLASGISHAQVRVESSWFSNVAVGIVNPLPVSSQELHFKNWNVEWSFNLYKALWRPSHNYFCLTLGADLVFPTMRAAEPVQYAKGNDNILTVKELPDGIDFKRSRIGVTQLRVPFSLGIVTFKDFGIEVGAAADLNLYAASKAVYKSGNTRTRLVEKNIKTNPVGFDFFALVHLDWFSLYAKYSPAWVMNTAGPSWQCWSVGIRLNFD